MSDREGLLARGSASTPRRAWTAEEDAALGGGTDAEVAERLGRSVPSARMRRSRLGVEAARVRVARQRRAEATKAWVEAGRPGPGRKAGRTLTQAQLAMRLGVARTTVSHYVNTLGYRRRAPADSPEDAEARAVAEAAGLLEPARRA